MYKKLLLCMGIGVIGVLGSFSFAHAADPQCIITWKSQNHAPTWFMGKIIPIRQSSVRVTLEAVSQNPADKGKILDLSNKEVRWYLNGDLVRKGTGMQELTIANNDLSGSNITGSVAFSYYDPTDNSAYFPECWFSIPVTNPLVFLSLPTSSLPTNTTSTITAIPFFFNTADQFLVATWTVNGNQVPATEVSSLALPLSIPSGAAGPVNVGVALSSNQDPFEQGNASYSFSLTQ